MFYNIFIGLECGFIDISLSSWYAFHGSVIYQHACAAAGQPLHPHDRGDSDGDAG